METMMALFRFNGVSACMKLTQSMSIEDISNFVIKRWPELKDCSMYLGYSLPPLIQFCELQNHEDFMNMFSMIEKYIPKHIEITVYRNRGESSRSKDFSEGDYSISAVGSSLMCTGSEVSSSHMQVDLIEDQASVLMTYRWQNCITGVNQMFLGGASEFRNELVKYSLFKGFEFNYVKNNHKKIVAVCKYADTLGCTWRIQGWGDESNSLFYIKKYSPEHTCGVGAISRKITRAVSDIISEVVVEKMRRNPLYRPIDCMDDFSKEYGFDISYSNAWHAVEKARGSHYGEYKYSYDQLRLYCEAARESNPGSYIVFETDASSRFRRVFFAFYACIEGFNFCRPLLFVDSTFLTGRYRGQLFCATAKDGNQQLFLVAYAVVDSENKDNWEWFMQNLNVILKPERIVTFVSDRNQSLLDGVSTIFPQSPHGYCTYHLKMNMRGYMVGKPAEIKDAVIKLFDKVIYATTTKYFNEKMEKLKKICGKRVISFLDSISPEHYSEAFFSGIRYGEVTSNAAESLNNKFKEERQLPIFGLCDGIRIRIMKDLACKRDTSALWKLPICPTIDKLIRTRINIGKPWETPKANDDIYEVRAKKSVMVDLKQRVCTCQGWQLHSFPCAHALAAIQKSKLPLINFIDEYYLTTTYQKTYALNIFPIPTLEIQPTTRESCHVLPPLCRAQPGRRRKTRIRSFGEPKKQMKCSICGKLGHNKKGCRQRDTS